ncbi:MAG: hypothetical protein O3A78_02045 [Nitrospinae bacterium]|nr:hypothetical protein [Nitrospinota bacterium]MDA1108592.1 hypothetical protein [Nitrospinota bacterium]
MALKLSNSIRSGRRIAVKLCFFLVVFLLSGCSGLGPSTLKGNRYNYNTTIQRSNDQQLLLNLVRLKYRDTPYFLEVNSVAAQFKFRANADADATLQNGVKGLFGFSAGASVEENPTVSYAPLQGEQFIQRFLSHIPLENIFLLTRSGWSFERILRVCLERVGNLKNAPTASGPTPETAPVYEDFAQAANLIRKLQLKDAHTLSLGASGNIPELIFQFEKTENGFPELQELNVLLGLPPENLRFVLTPYPSPDDPQHIRVETRSLLGMMYYLSHAVEAPEEDQMGGKVTLTRYSSGKPFNWADVTGELLKIHSQSTQPAQAAMAVNYRDSWFYIDDSDLQSKSTFSLLAQIFSLQSGNAKDKGPLLTLPLGN